MYGILRLQRMTATMAQAAHSGLAAVSEVRSIWDSGPESEIGMLPGLI